METKTKVEKTSESVKNVNLTDRIEQTVKLINEQVAKRGYRFFVDGKQVDSIAYNASDLKLEEKSLSFKKHILNRIQKVERTLSLRQMNMFLHALGLGKIKVSEREEQIKKARKEWVELRDKAEAALKKYKEVKGDFYKVK